MSVCREKDKAYVNVAIIALNVLVFVFLETRGSTEDAGFMVKWGAIYIPQVFSHGEYYRLLTAMFLHFGASHLVNNMLVLFVLGERFELVMGHINYCVFYLFSGLLANLASVYVQLQRGLNGWDVTAGASGAIFGVVGGLSYVVAVNRGQLNGLTNRQLGFMALLTLYHGFNSKGVDNAAHLGGLIAGFLLAVIMYRGPQQWKKSAMEHKE